jgi:hypothetical protein
MSDHQPSGLLNLPAELRLEVYQYLVIHCLAEGSTRDVAGVYLCCREIHTELETEHISKVRPLLKGKYRWEKNAQYVAPIRFEMNTTRAAREDGACLVVRMPIGKEWLGNKFGCAEDNEGFREMVESLRPALGLPWSILTPCFYDPTGVSRKFGEIDILFVFLLSCLHERAGPGTCTLRRTNRLVLMHPHKHENNRLSIDMLDAFWGDFVYVRRLSRGPSGFALAH